MLGRVLGVYPLTTWPLLPVRPASETEKKRIEASGGWLEDGTGITRGGGFYHCGWSIPPKDRKVNRTYCSWSLPFFLVWRYYNVRQAMVGFSMHDDTSHLCAQIWVNVTSTLPICKIMIITTILTTINQINSFLYNLGWRLMDTNVG